LRLDRYRFGSVRIDGVIYEGDVVIDRGKVRLRDKKPSRRFRSEYGHTPLSAEEKLPWKCRRLVIGTGAQGALPVMPDVRRRAKEKGVELVALPTSRAIQILAEDLDGVNAVLHLTC
jgi:hypothetical protein